MVPFRTVDAKGNTVEAHIDFRTMSPRRLVDPNENRAEAITDALGMVIATSVYEHKEGIENGDRPLDEYEVQFSDDPDNPIPNRHDVLKNSETYLQGATTFFFYDVDAWVDREEPIQAIGLARETHVSDEPPSIPSNIQKTITYTDGFGRELQSKLKVEDGPAWERVGEEFVWNEDSIPRWLASGRTVYNNKEKPKTKR